MKHSLAATIIVSFRGVDIDKLKDEPGNKM